MAKPGVYDFEWPQGDTFNLSLVWNDADEVPIPLGGYTARMQLRTAADSDDVVLELTTENGRITLTSPGGIAFNVDAEDMAAITAGSYRYDLEMVTGANVRKILKGKMKIVAEVTREEA